MAEGIYSSGMSVWERNQKRLKPDHAGFDTIKEDEPVEVVVEEEKSVQLELPIEKKEDEPVVVDEAPELTKAQAKALAKAEKLAAEKK